MLTSTARKPEPAKLAKDNVYSYEPQPRPRTVRYQGERPPEHAITKLPQPQTVVERENPMSAAAEPYSPPVRPERKPHWRDKLEVRRVTEADLSELMSWGFPRWKEIFPRLTQEGILPMLRLALAGSRYAFLRTDTACGLFIAVTTPWEPELVVYDIFVVSKSREDDDLDRFSDAREANQFKTSLASGMQPLAIMQAAYKWAKDIGAIEFRYGTETKYDISPIADKIGYDNRITGYVKKITKE